MRSTTLWLLFSNTKVLTTAAWSLVEDGALSFHDRVADHIPEFATHGKDDITLFQLATIRPVSQMPMSVVRPGPIMPACAPNLARAGMAGRSRSLSRPQRVWCSRWWSGGHRARFPRSHPRARHRTARSVDELFVVFRPRNTALRRCSRPTRFRRATSPEFREAGLPHGGGFGTARAMAAFCR
jgi:hypothetical protein